AWDADYLLNHDQSVEYFRNFLFEQFLEEFLRGARHDDLRLVSFKLYAFDDSADVVSFAEKVRRNLLFFRQDDFVSFVVNQNYDTRTYVVNFGSVNFANKILELLVKIRIVVFVDF